MKIMNQKGNTVADYKKVYIVDVIDKFNIKWSRIDGELMSSLGEKLPLGKYRDNDQAKQVLKLLLLEPDMFAMPVENFEEDDTFIYPSFENFGQ